MPETSPFGPQDTQDSGWKLCPGPVGQQVENIGGIDEEEGIDKNPQMDGTVFCDDILKRLFNCFWSFIQSLPGYYFTMIQWHCSIISRFPTVLIISFGVGFLRGHFSML